MDLKNTNRPICNCGFQSERGFTLVGAIVMVAFLGIFAYVIFGVIQNSMTVRRIVETSSSYKDIDSAFKAALVDELHRLLNPTTGTCAGAPVSINRLIGTEGARFVTSNTIAPWPTGAPPRHAAAIARCRRSFRAPPSSQDYYFCVEFSGINNTSFAANSFNGAPKAMAEVRARVISLDTGLPLGNPPVPCSPPGPSNFCCLYKQGFNYFASKPEKAGNSILEIQYSLYWYGRGNPNIFKSANGSFYASSFK